MGLADADFVLLAEEAGRAALPEPLVEQAGVAVPALREFAALPQVASLMPQLAAGTARIAVVHPCNPFANVPPAVTHWLACESETVYLLEAQAVQALAEPSIDAGRRLMRLRRKRTAPRRWPAAARPASSAGGCSAAGALYFAQCLGLPSGCLP
jgi:hypothetical protein